MCEVMERYIQENEKKRIAYMLNNGKTSEEIVEFCGYELELVMKVQSEIMQLV